MWFGKRAFDFLLAVLGLFLLSPLFLIIAIFIKIDSKGPIFYRQVRIGQFGAPFLIHKFRTMYNDSDRSGRLITVGEDIRITKLGVILRRYKLDELAQLIDVLLGKMSIVGPRPEIPKYVKYYPDKLKSHILSVRPGITDWASIYFRNENLMLDAAEDPEKTYIEQIVPQKLDLAKSYIECASLKTDLKIIFSTLNYICFKK